MQPGTGTYFASSFTTGAVHRGQAGAVCFQRELLDHHRLVLERT